MTFGNQAQDRGARSVVGVSLPPGPVSGQSFGTDTEIGVSRTAADARASIPLSVCLPSIHPPVHPSEPMGSDV